MAVKDKETATERARLFPSTYTKLRIRAANGKGGKTIAEVTADIERKATLFEKLQKK